MRSKFLSLHLVPCLAVLLLFFPFHCGGATRGADSYQVKADFLFNLADFVTWPESSFPSPASSFSICVLGNDIFADLLEKLVRGEKIKERDVSVEKADDPRTMGRCHILFIDSSQAAKLSEIFPHVPKRATLTVGDHPDFLRKGGMVNLISARNRIRIEIAPDSAKNAGIGISSKLLRLSTDGEEGKSKRKSDVPFS